MANRREEWVVLTYEKQALSGAIEVLLRSELPDEFEGTKLYGSLEEDELRQDCKIFRLSNETGHGRITVYQVFSGIELYYNDMHMGYCNQNQATAKNMIEINHCLIGRFECSFGENSCCYMAEGDLSISSMMKKKSNSCFPLNHYHGISIIINLDELLLEVRQIMELMQKVWTLYWRQKSICPRSFQAVFPPTRMTMMTRTRNPPRKQKPARRKCCNTHGKRSAM